MTVSSLRATHLLPSNSVTHNGCLGRVTVWCGNVGMEEGGYVGEGFWGRGSVWCVVISWRRMVLPLSAPVCPEMLGIHRKAPGSHCALQVMRALMLNVKDGKPRLVQECGYHGNVCSTSAAHLPAPVLVSSRLPQRGHHGHSSGLLKGSGPAS